MDKKNQITEGVIWKQLLIFFFPIMVGTLFQQLYNTVDAIIVGRFVGKQALASVGGSAAVLTNFVIGFFTGLSAGATVIISQFYGAKNLKQLSKGLHTAYAFSITVSILISVIGWFSTPALLHLLKTPADVIPDSILYLRIYFLGMIFTLTYNMGSSIMRAIGDSRRPLIYLVICCVINIILDILFVIVFHMGIAGAAIATVISQAVSGIGCLIYSWKKFEILHPDAEERRWNSSYMKTLCGMGVPMGLQYSITAIGSVILQSAVNTLGSNAVASMTAGSKIGMFFCCPFDAMGSTMATYGGQNVGAKKMDRISKGLKACSMLGIGYAILAFVILALTGRNLALFFVERTEVEVIGNVYLFLLINSAFYIPLAFVNIVRFLIQGMGYSKFAILAGVCEMAARTLVGFALVPLFGFPAACFASPVAWIFADAFLFPAYRHVYRKTEKMLNVSIQ